MKLFFWIDGRYVHQVTSTESDSLGPFISINNRASRNIEMHTHLLTGIVAEGYPESTEGYKRKSWSVRSKLHREITGASDYLRAYADPSLLKYPVMV